MQNGLVVMAQNSSPSNSCIPAEAIVHGLTVRPLPENYTPLEAVVVLKCIDPDGDTCYITRYTPDVHSIEILGMLHAAIQLLNRDVVAQYIPDEGEDDG
jgi:hypothetical protein